MENTNVMDSIEEVRVSEKYALTIPEAANLFNVGQNQIRVLARIPGNKYTLKIGVKILIKREKFKEYLDGRNEL